MQFFHGDSQLWSHLLFCAYIVSLFSLVEAVAQGLSRAPGLMPPKVLSLPTLSSPQIATRKAYGQALAKLGHASDRIIALDGDTKNSTFSELFKKEHPDRFIECYIAEQNMVGRTRWGVGAVDPWAWTHDLKGLVGEG